MSLVNLCLTRLCSVSRNTAFHLKKVSFSLSAVSNRRGDIPLPSNVGGKAGKFRRIVHYPEEYTVKPLKITRLGGRDPVSGKN